MPKSNPLKEEKMNKIFIAMMAIITAMALASCAGTTDRILDGVTKIDQSLDNTLGGMVIRSNTSVSNSVTKEKQSFYGDSFSRTICTEDRDFNRSQDQQYDSQTGDRRVTHSMRKTNSTSCWGEKIYPRLN